MSQDISDVTYFAIISSRYFVDKRYFIFEWCLLNQMVYAFRYSCIIALKKKSYFYKNICNKKMQVVLLSKYERVKSSFNIDTGGSRLMLLLGPGKNSH